MASNARMQRALLAAEQNCRPAICDERLRRAMRFANTVCIPADVAEPAGHGRILFTSVGKGRLSFHQNPHIEQLRRLQSAVDDVNGPLNLDSSPLVLGAELTGQNNTKLRREMLSKCPSTKWNDRIDIAI